MKEHLEDRSILRRLISLSDICPFPVDLAMQESCYQFALLAFLSLQSVKPNRILESGTTVGASFLSLCHAVEKYDLPSECICIPLVTKIGNKPGTLEQFEVFRGLHDARYSRFSKIDITGDCVRKARMSDHRFDFNFDFIHIVKSGSSDRFAADCFTWLRRLNPSGVAFISGPGKVDRAELQLGLGALESGYSFRLFQFEDWIAAASIRPIGIIRDLLQSPDDDFVILMDLIKNIGNQVRLTNEANSLCSRLKSSEERELEARIECGEVRLRLDEMWVEKEEYRKQLTKLSNPANDSTQKEPSTYVDPVLFSNVKGILLRLSERYAANAEPSLQPGREFWDRCGRSVLESILSKQLRLTFPRPYCPKVSIIIVVRNKAHLSVLCLAALLLDTRVNYELIVVDNGSSDETSEIFSLVDSAIFIRNDENNGFGSAVMEAVKCASGEYLCFLNNDAILPPGNLGRLLRVFEVRPDSGAVGGKVHLADGRLQEAGCIVWRDGRTRQWGRDDDPRRPQYNFRRAVDYCSGVFLLTPRSLFESVGGFDERYAPAYYEDVDYCMKMWEANRSVIYEPQSVVHHYEGASTIEASLVTRQMISVIHRKFTERWRNALRRHSIDRTENVIRGRIAATSKSLRYLCFVRCFRDQVLDGILDHRVRQILSWATQGHTVTCIHENEDDQSGLIDPLNPEVEVRGLKSMGYDEVDKYCAASDYIVFEESLTGDQNLRKILRAYIGKTIRADDFYSR